MPLPNIIVKRLERAFEESNKHLLKAENARLSLAYKIESTAHRRKIDNAKQRLAYLACRLPATYAVCETVLEHLSQTDLSFATSLDLGAGPGTATLCASYLFPELQDRILIDYDREFRRFALENLPTGQNDYQLMDLATITGALPKRDLIMMSYSLNELSNNLATEIVHKAWEATKKAFVLIEPGTPKCFDRLRRIRENLIQYGAKILAPCPHENACPLSTDDGAVTDDWCHFSKRLERSPFHRFVKDASLTHEDEKYSYLIAIKDKTIPRPQNRILKKPIKRTGHVIFDLCTENGLQRLTLSKKNKTIYKQALKYNWGEAFDVEETVSKDDA